MTTLTHKQLVIEGEKWLKKKGAKITMREIGAATRNHESPDVIGWFPYRRTVVIECKTSRPDFLSDKNKYCRRYPDKGMGDYRIYLCPIDVIKIEDLPDGWGLLYHNGKKICNVFGIEKRSVSCWIRTKLRKCKVSETDMLLSGLRRLVLRGHLEEIYNGFKNGKEKK